MATPHKRFERAVGCRHLSASCGYIGARGYFRFAMPLVLLLCAFPFASAELGPIAARHGAGGAVIQMEPRLLSNEPYVAVKDLRELFNDENSPVRLRYFYRSSTRRLSVQLRMPSGQSRIVRLKMGSAEAAIGTRGSVSMRRPAVEIAGEPWTPIQFLTEAIPKAAPVLVEYDAGARELVVRAADSTPEAEPPMEPSDPTPIIESTLPETPPYALMELEAPVWTGLKVAVDAGHGGSDVGLERSGAVEKDLTLALAKEIKTAAALAGGAVFLTRADDAARALEERMQAAEEGGATAFISLHFNDSISSGRSGYRIVTLPPDRSSTEGENADRRASPPEDAEKLADAVEEALKEAGFEGKRLRLPLPALERANRPALYIEMAYLSNAEEAGYWLLSQTIESAAAAIWNGAARYKP
ncbi:MAG: N-acetylmuramoyl-L-alanine amidase [Candidatus Poribacteria bacterium]|nr:N-acetylmuramoyl-L-alanine amidase [Candidatus Poribacteria bacterium]